MPTAGVGCLFTTHTGALPLPLQVRGKGLSFTPIILHLICTSFYFTSGILHPVSFTLTLTGTGASLL